MKSKKTKSKNCLTSEQLATKWINELEVLGFTYDEMLKVFKLARQIYLKMKA